MLGWLLPLLFGGLRPQRPRIHRPLLITFFVFKVGYDVLLSNIDVAWGVLRLHKRTPRFGFVTIPLDTRDPSALAALAMVTTVVPGTVWCELAPDNSAVTLHVWDLVSEASFILHYKSRYEAPLLEIFR